LGAHLDRAQDEDRRERDQHRPAALHERDAERDHDGAHHDGRDDPDREHLALVLLGCLERVKEHHEDEEVVDCTFGG
jgi:hypothetical protein